MLNQLINFKSYLILSNFQRKLLLSDFLYLDDSLQQSGCDQLATIQHLNVLTEILNPQYHKNNQRSIVHRSSGLLSEVLLDCRANGPNACQLRSVETKLH